MKKVRKHLLIPDCQVTPNSPTDHLSWIGQYIVDKKPDVIVNIGDFADMESLSSYDRGKLQFEGRRYQADCHASRNGMSKLLKPLHEYNEKRRRDKKKIYKPEKHLTLGNHEYRITRACESQPEYDGLLSIDHLGFDEWNVHRFLDILTIDGLSYSHYFYNPMSGRPYGGFSMDTRLKNVGFSFVQGHQQIYLHGVRALNNGTRLRGLVLGSCYLHDEVYRGHQANGEWRGIVMFHEVHNGDYNLMEISLDFLCRRYEGIPLWRFMELKYPAIFNNSTWMKKQKELAPSIQG